MMISGAFLFWAVIVIGWIVMTIHYLKSDKPAVNAFKGMLSGVITLAAVYFFGGYIGIYLTLNLFTCITALVFGAPGIIVLCMIEKFFV